MLIAPHSRGHHDRQQPPAAQRRVDRLVQALADQRQTGHQQHDGEARVETRPPDAGAGIGERPVEVVSPLGGLGRLDAQPEEAQPRQGEDRVRRVERAEHRHALHHVAEQVTAHDDEVAGADGSGGLDVRRLLRAHRGVADHPEVLGNVDRRQRESDGKHAAAQDAGEQEREHDRQQERREREERVHDQHQDPVQPPAVIARDQSERHTDRDADQDRQHDDLDRRSCPPDHPGEDVEEQPVGAEQVVAARRTRLGEPHSVDRGLGEAVGSDQRREHRADDETGGDDQPGDEHPASQPRGLPERLGEELEELPHQYLTRGSMSALTMSTRRLISTTATAKMVMMPWTAP